MTWQSRIKPANWRSIWLCSIKGNGYWVFFLFYCYCIYYVVLTPLPNHCDKLIAVGKKRDASILFFFPTQLIASWIQTNGDTISRLSSLTLYHDHDNSDRTDLEIAGILLRMCWDFTESLLRFYWDFAENLLRIWWKSSKILLRFYLDSTENLLRLYWESAENLQRISWESPEKLLRISWESPESLLRISLESTENLLRISWESPESLLRISWNSPENLLIISWESHGSSWGW